MAGAARKSSPQRTLHMLSATPSPSRCLSPGGSDEEVEVIDAGQRNIFHCQPLMRGVTEIGNQNAQGWAWGVALPVSYLLFFKRATS